MKNLAFFLALLLSSCSTVLLAQYDPYDHYDTDQNTVVAVNGLKLRSKPSLRGKVIDKIPFGQRIEILGERHYGRDTLASDYRIYYAESEEYYEPLLSGHWVKARYDEQEGYVFSAFLYHRFDADQEYNQKIALLTEGGNCYDNLHYRADWHWYGLYEVEGVHQLRKVKLDFFVEETELGPFLTITTQQNRASLFIVGSPRPLSEGRLFFSEYTGHGTSVYRGGEIDEAAFRRAALEIVRSEGEEYPQLVARGRDGRGQVLNPLERYFGYPLSLLWYGDLDGDGQVDYLINYGEESSETILYLSGQAQSGQLVAPVGAYFSGYCC
ncbi:MAG: SH3 domain-containing protein [Bacteroidota bacterium]